MPMGALSDMLMAAGDPALQEWRKTLLWAGPAIAVLLLLTALVLAWVKRWNQKPARDRLTASDQLAHFRELYEQGELSREEFERLRGLLSERLKKEMEPAPVAPADPPPSPGPSESAAK